MIRARPVARLGELRLLVWVAAFTLAGYVAVVAAASGRFAWYEIVVPIAVLAIFGALHLFLTSVGFRGDQLLLPIAVGLTGIGFILVERLAPGLLLQQLSWLVIGGGAFCVTILIPRDLSVLARYKYTWALLGVVLLVSPLLPVVGREINGARIWVGIPGADGRSLAQFEPWELVKIALVIFFAAYLEEYREVLSTPPRRFGPIPVPPIPYLIPIVGMWLVAMLVMVFEKDLGATLLFFGIFLAMLYLATGEPFYVVIGLLMLVGGGFVAYHAFAHVAARVDVWLAPFNSDLRFDQAYQLTQGLFSLANAGLLGAGLGNGMPERIPVVWSDFVFDAFTEEVGVRRRARAARLLPRLRVPRHAHRAPRADDVPAAARGRPVVHRRVPDPRDRRRERQAHSADRHHAAVRRIRRVVARDELHAVRPASPSERHHRAGATVTG